PPSHPNIPPSAASPPCSSGANRDPHSFPTRRSSDLAQRGPARARKPEARRHAGRRRKPCRATRGVRPTAGRNGRRSPGYGKGQRSEEHTSELQSRENLVCRLLLEKKKSTERSHGRAQ